MQCSNYSNVTLAKGLTINALVHYLLSIKEDARIEPMIIPIEQGLIH
jgi:hypothetical protein